MGPCFPEEGRGPSRLELVFHLCLDGAVAGGVADTKQSVSSLDLIIVKEALVGLIDGSRKDFSRTGTARPCAAGIGKIDTLLLGGIEDVGVIRACEGRTAFESDGVLSHAEKHSS